MSTFVVSVDEIHVDPSLNVSRGGRWITPESVSELASDILDHGLLEPVGVTSDPDWIDLEEQTGKRFLLVYGFRRFASVVSLDAKEIRVTDLGPISQASAELANVAENWSREPPNDFDLTQACARFVRVLKVDPKVVSKRVNRPVSFVEECVSIVERVRSDLLDHYRVTCTREMRRRMRALAAIEGTERERHERQGEWWREQESVRTEIANTDPVGRNRPAKRAKTKAVAGRSDHIQAAERLLMAREVYDGQGWRPLDEQTRAVLRRWIQWAIDPNSELPVR